MITTPITSLTPAMPGMPSPQQEISKHDLNQLITNEDLDVYVLFFLQRGGNKMCERRFKFDGDIRQAITRCKVHCEKLGIRFVRVEPFLHNLDDLEKRHA